MNKEKFRLPEFDGAELFARATQSPTLQLLEETKLSRRKPMFNMRDLKACSVCGGELEAGNDFQQSTKICRKCLSVFAQVGTVLDAHALEKIRRAKLEKWGNK